MLRRCTSADEYNFLDWQSLALQGQAGLLQNLIVQSDHHPECRLDLQCLLLLVWLKACSPCLRHRLLLRMLKLKCSCSGQEYQARPLHYDRGPGSWGGH